MDLTPLLQAIAGVIVIVITYYLIPYLRNLVGQEQLVKAYSVISILVKAVEQVTKVTGAGAKKKELVKERLKSYDIKLDEAKINELIEAAVLEMNVAINDNKE